MNLKLSSNKYINLIKKEIFDEKGIFIRLIKKSIKKLYFRKIFLYLLFLVYPLFFILYRNLYKRNKNFFTKRILKDYKRKDYDSINLIAITHAGRSGSYLMSNIFDTHSQIISLPPSPCFYYGPLEIIKILKRIKFSSFFVFYNSKFFRKWWKEILEKFIIEKYSDIFLFGTNHKGDTGIVEKENNLNNESFIMGNKVFSKKRKRFINSF